MCNIILSWNVRDLGAPKKKVLVKRLILFARADHIILLESKLEVVLPKDIRDCTGSSKWSWEALPSIRASGGIILLWNPSKIEVSEVTYPAWCLGGDFNNVRSSDEKAGGSRITLSMRKFNDFIDDHQLVDYYPLQDALYTWKKGNDSPIMSRLDRFLASQPWDQKYNRLTQSALPQITSDHKPNVLELGGAKWGPTPFRFEAMWIKEEGFFDLVKQFWLSYQFRGSPSSIFYNKLKTLKVDLKKWNLEIFERLELKLGLLLDEITQLDKLDDMQWNSLGSG